METFDIGDPETAIDLPTDLWMQQKDYQKMLETFLKGLAVEIQPYLDSRLKVRRNKRKGIIDAPINQQIVEVKARGLLGILGFGKVRVLVDVAEGLLPNREVVVSYDLSGSSYHPNYGDLYNLLKDRAKNYAVCVGADKITFRKESSLWL